MDAHPLKKDERGGCESGVSDCTKGSVSIDCYIRVTRAVLLSCPQLMATRKTTAHRGECGAVYRNVIWTLNETYK